MGSSWDDDEKRWDRCCCIGYCCCWLIMLSLSWHCCCVFRGGCRCNGIVQDDNCRLRVPYVKRDDAVEKVYMGCRGSNHATLITEIRLVIGITLFIVIARVAFITVTVMGYFTIHRGSFTTHS